MSALVKSDPIVAQAFVVHLLNEALKIIPNNIASATELKNISEMLMAEYWYMKTEDFIRCIKMGIMGKLTDHKGDPIKVYGSLSAKDFFEWFTAYDRISSREMDGIMDIQHNEIKFSKSADNVMLKIAEKIGVTNERVKQTENDLKLLSHIEKWHQESIETRKEREKLKKQKEKEE